MTAVLWLLAAPVRRLVAIPSEQSAANTPTDDA
jgi:hypothetical protein